MSATASILSNVVKPTALDVSVPKVISPTAHGIIDYAHSAFFLGLGLFYRNSNKQVASAALGTGALLLAQAALTDYRFGVEPMIPFAVHGEMDAVFSSVSWLVPRLFGFSGTAASRIFEVNSIVEAAIVRLTDFDSERARREREEY